MTEPIIQYTVIMIKHPANSSSEKWGKSLVFN
jgi:hypothetical protein